MAANYEDKASGFRGSAAETLNLKAEPSFLRIIFVFPLLIRMVYALIGLRTNRSEETDRVEVDVEVLLILGRQLAERDGRRLPRITYEEIPVKREAMHAKVRCRKMKKTRPLYFEEAFDEALRCLDNRFS